jgi:hypothetical protein
MDNDWLLRLQTNIERWEKLREGEFVNPCTLISFNCHKCPGSDYEDMDLCKRGVHKFREYKEEDSELMIEFLEKIIEDDNIEDYLVKIPVDKEGNFL